MFDRDDLLKMMKLERQRSAGSRTLGTLGIFLGGAAVGAGIALLLAPKAGAELRRELMPDKASHAQGHESDTHPLVERPESFSADGVA